MTRSAQQGPETPDSETCWSVLERVASGSQLKRATRLRELLLFVGQRSLKDGCTQVREQEIGIEVFGRREAYDTAVDNIVRTNVSDLRKRIDAYFESEGLQETVIMEIPRGSYIPVFRYRLVDAEKETPELSEIALPVGAEQLVPLVEGKRHLTNGIWAHPRRLATAAAFYLLVVCCMVLWLKNRADEKSIEAMHQALHPWASSPGIADLWSGFFVGHQDTDIILSDSAFLLIQSLNKQSFSFNEYLNRSYLSQLDAENLSPDKRSALDLFTSKSLGNPGEFKIAERIQALEPGSKTIHVFNAHDYAPALLRQDNVILIGSKRSNPWVELFDNRLNFALATDFSHPQTVTNRAPAANEQSSYTIIHEAGYTVGYCTIAYLPNTGQNGRLLLIEGTSSEATQAGGEFLLSEEQFSKFQKMLRTVKLPYFEVLLRATHVRNTPIAATIVAYRTYPNL